MSIGEIARWIMVMGIAVSILASLVWFVLCEIGARRKQRRWKRFLWHMNRQHRDHDIS